MSSVMFHLNVDQDAYTHKYTYSVHTQPVLVLLLLYYQYMYFIFPKLLNTGLISHRVFNKGQMHDKVMGTNR